MRGVNHLNLCLFLTLRQPLSGGRSVPVALQPCYLDPVSTEVPSRATTTNRPIKPKPDQPAVFLKPAPPPRLVIKSIIPNATTAAASSSISTDVTYTSAIALSKTTYYRHLKKGDVSKGKRIYTCKKCNKPMEPPHRQFKGIRYCHEVDKMPHEDWLIEVKDYFKKKKEGGGGQPEAVIAHASI